MDVHVLESMNEVISYDYSSSHKAIDVVGTGNTVDDVVAYDDGVVEIVVKDVKYTDHNTTGTATYGNFVKIRHDDGTKSLYAHLKYGTVLVFSGQRVSRGQKLGTMGATGNAYGAHLHFEIRDSNEKRLNPKDYLYRKLISSVSDEPVSMASTEEVKAFAGAEEVETDVPTNSTEEAIPNVVSESISEDEPVVSENTSSTSSLNDTISETVNSTVKDKSYNRTSSSNDSKNNASKSTKVISYSGYLENSDYRGGSIVDGLKGIGADSSFEHRGEIALKNGISNYKGSYSQNVYLLKLLKQGKLKV